MDATGRVEDHARCFPTPSQLLVKALRMVFGKKTDLGRYHYALGSVPFFVDWVAGIFVLCQKETFSKLGGFDERYWLYYEDVDLCARAWRHGFAVVVCPQVGVIHEGQRASRRDLRHFRWHLQSITRYLRDHWGRLPKVAEAGQPVRDLSALQKP